LERTAIIPRATQQRIDALDLVRKAAPRSGVWTIPLPQVSGFEVNALDQDAPEFRRDPRLSRVTSFAMKGDRRTDPRRLLRGVLSKPISSASFIETVGVLLGRS